MTEIVDDSSTPLRQAWLTLRDDRHSRLTQLALDYDTRRAELLAGFSAAGLSPRAIAEAVGISKTSSDERHL